MICTQIDANFAPIGAKIIFLRQFVRGKKFYGIRIQYVQ